MATSRNLRRVFFAEPYAFKNPEFLNGRGESHFNFVLPALYLANPESGTASFHHSQLQTMCQEFSDRSEMCYFGDTANSAEMAGRYPVLLWHFV